jgi:hypothetical protein
MRCNNDHFALPRAAWRAVLAMGHRCRHAHAEHFACLLCIAECKQKPFNKPLHQYSMSAVAQRLSSICAPYPHYAVYLLLWLGFLSTAVASS